MGGQGIFRIRENDANINVIIETMTEVGQTPVMMQRYIPEIKQGDKRVLMFCGEPVTYSLARIPADGETRGNIAAGGQGVGMKLTPKERQIAKDVGLWLKETQLQLVGLDIIGGYLTEVNVTCPTCLRELDAQFSLNLAGDLFDNMNL
jgi:glutathione synthase